MKTRKIVFIANVSIVIFLSVGWLYFYSMIILDDITRMPGALTINAAIFGLNIIFASSLILLPITYRNRK